MSLSRCILLVTLKRKQKTGTRTHYQSPCLPEATAGVLRRFKSLRLDWNIVLSLANIRSRLRLI